MRVLLTATASYDPPKGGSTRSNLVWLDAVRLRGHECLIVCGGDADEINGEIVKVRDLSRRASVVKEHIANFRPDWVLVSSEDVAHTVLREAWAAAPDRLVYLAHTPQWYPFGPAAWHQDAQATAIVRQARAIVVIAHTTKRYIREHAGAESHVIHPPIYGEPPWPRFGSNTSGCVLMVNPSAVKGISIFLDLARRFPDVPFAGLAGWGTTSADRKAMQALPNVSIIETVPSIDDVLRDARILLMPSLWFEGFGLIAMDAMLRGLPVVASDAGGLVEAKQGTGYVIPVRPIERWEASFDETHMPKPVLPPHDIAPWEIALQTLLSDPRKYEEEAQRSRDGAERFVSGLRASDFADMLESLTRGEAPTAAKKPLTAAQQALLLERLRHRKS